MLTSTSTTTFIITTNIFGLSITFDVNFQIILIIGVIIGELDDLVFENSFWEIGFLSSWILKFTITMMRIYVIFLIAKEYII